MQIKFLLDSSNPIIGEASIDIDKPIKDVYAFIGDNFFENYPKWAVEVVEFEPESKTVSVGAKAKQIRKDNGEHVESVFEITTYEPNINITCQGLTAPYRQNLSLIHI